MSKQNALRFFDSVTGILSIDLREVVLHCLRKLSNFFRQFEGTILSPKASIRNINSKKPVMPRSFFTLTLQIINRNEDLEDK